MSAPLWGEIRGQGPALALLQRAVAADRVAHAYAFIGPAGIGRRLAALGLAQACLCPHGGCVTCSACRRVAAGHHPDCQLLAPTPPRENPRGPVSLRIGEIRELMHWAALAPLEGARKVFILDDADRLTEQAAEALLKTLEEPPPRTLLVLIVANPRALPATVLSRCQPVRFRALGEADAAAVLAARGVDADQARLLARLTRGRIGVALGTDLGAVRASRDEALSLLEGSRAALAPRLDEAPPDRAAVAGRLEAYWLWYRDALCLAAGGAEGLVVNADRLADVAALARRVPVDALAAAIDGVKAAREALETNVSPRLVLEDTLLAAPRAPAPA